MIIQSNLAKNQSITISDRKTLEANLSKHVREVWDVIVCVFVGDVANDEVITFEISYSHGAETLRSRLRDTLF